MELCSACWHEDCTCGLTLAERAANARLLAVREAAERLAAESGE
jgi:hypothetical protein